MSAQITAFPLKSKVAVPKTEVLEQPQSNMSLRKIHSSANLRMLYSATEEGPDRMLQTLHRIGYGPHARLDEKRMEEIVPFLKEIGRKASGELGWTPV
jgi:hypothetical protein